MGFGRTIHRTNLHQVEVVETLLASGSSARSFKQVSIPDYLYSVYYWAYLSPIGQAIFDHNLVVRTILFGNMYRLIEAAVIEVEEGQTVLQPACVYGNFSAVLAETIGTLGHLVITDIAPIQVANACRKLAHLSQTTILLADAAQPIGGPYDVVICFFLLHEVPEDYKYQIVNALLNTVVPGGKVVFVDYHRPNSLHPMKPLMRIIFSILEPFAQDLWYHEIQSYSLLHNHFAWYKETFYGGLYQKVVARRLI